MQACTMASMRTTSSVRDENTRCRHFSSRYGRIRMRMSGPTSRYWNTASSSVWYESSTGSE